MTHCVKLNLCQICIYSCSYFLQQFKFPLMHANGQISTSNFLDIVYIFHIHIYVCIFIPSKDCSESARLSEHFTGGGRQFHSKAPCYTVPYCIVLKTGWTNLSLAGMEMFAYQKRSYQSVWQFHRVLCKQIHLNNCFWLWPYLLNSLTNRPKTPKKGPPHLWISCFLYFL